MNNGQDSSKSLSNSSPAMASVTPAASTAGSQSAADLDWLLTLWATIFAEDNDTTIKWIAYKETDIDSLLPKTSELSKSVYSLSMKQLGPDNVQIQQGPESFSELAMVGDFELVIHNDSANAQNTKRTLKRTMTKQESTTWTTSITTSVGLEFGAGVPLIAATKATLNLALAKTSTENETKISSEEHAIEQSITAHPWKSVFAAVYAQEKKVKTSIEAKVELVGGVVICCNKKIIMPGRAGTHLKGYVPIKDVFQHLQSYVNKTSVLQRDREKLRQALLCFELEGSTVKFTIRGEIHRHEIVNATVKIREEDIPRAEVGPAALTASVESKRTAGIESQIASLAQGTSQTQDIYLAASAGALQKNTRAENTNENITSDDIQKMMREAPRHEAPPAPGTVRVTGIASGVTTTEGSTAVNRNVFYKPALSVQPERGAAASPK